MAHIDVMYLEHYCEHRSAHSGGPHNAYKRTRFGTTLLKLPLITSMFDSFTGILSHFSYLRSLAASDWSIALVTVSLYQVQSL